MARASFKRTSDGIEKSLQGMVERGRSLSAYFERVVWPLYQQAQLERWESENATQGTRWAPIDADSPYGRRKRRLFASYPGAGKATMIATGHLAEGAEGRNPDYFVKLITDKLIRVSVNLSALPYAKYPGVMRPFMVFSDAQESEWAHGASAYMMRGKT